MLQVSTPAPVRGRDGLQTAQPGELLHIRLPAGLSPARAELWALRVPSLPRTHRDEHNCACNLLAYALQDFLHPSPATDTVQPFTLPVPSRLPRMERDSKGKPYFPDDSGIPFFQPVRPVRDRTIQGESNIQFNISHTCGAVLVGISSGGAIGVDIASTCPSVWTGRPGIERLRRRYFPHVRSPEEFARAWVFMESAGKWSGDGIFAMLRGSSVAPDGISPRLPRAAQDKTSVSAHALMRERDSHILPLPDDNTCYPPVPVSGFRYIPLETFPGYAAGVAIDDDMSDDMS